MVLLLSFWLWIDIFFVVLTNKKLLLPLLCRLNTNLFLDFANLREYLAAAVNVVISNPSVGLLPKTKISLFLLPICTDELIWAPRIIPIYLSFILLTKILNDNRILSRICYIFIYLDQYFQLITALNKKLPNVKSVFKSLDQGFSVSEIHKFTTFWWKKMPLILEHFLTNNTRGSRWCSIKLWAKESTEPIFLILVSDIPLDFYE